MSSRPWSCDTFVARADRTGFAGTMLAKNSDRPAGECQPLRVFPRRPGGGSLSLGGLRIDQPETSWAHLGA
ncbi:MAG TPA: hypothetical protein VHC49_27675 [Mycobacteriales bacterium]|nr:hypothetical protein [Mycobacteriales bacterium]